MEKYTLQEYANLLQNLRMMKEFYSNGEEEKNVGYLTYDSREVTEGTLFICKGAAFKAEYLDAAIEKGAIAYVSEVKYETKEDVPYFLVDDIRKAMPPLAEKFNNAPWKKLTITGIGGTKGKSTSAYYMKAIVDDYMEATGGKESAVLSSIDIVRLILCGKCDKCLCCTRLSVGRQASAPCRRKWYYICRDGSIFTGVKIQSCR